MPRRKSGLRGAWQHKNSLAAVFVYGSSAYSGPTDLRTVGQTINECVNPRNPDIKA